jgi:hypothetical protein
LRAQIGKLTLSSRSDKLLLPEESRKQNPIAEESSSALFVESGFGTATVDNRTNSLGERVVTVVHRLIGDRPTSRLVCSDGNLAEFGLTSLDAVRLVLLVEDEFDLTIPLGKITPANFRSVSTISRLISELLNNA